MKKWILGLRTDRPEAELYLSDGQKIVDHTSWLAHRELSITLLEKIEDIVNKNKISAVDLTGVVVFEGPGSFTGLRIGVAVANALGYALSIPVVGFSGDEWLASGSRDLESSEFGNLAAPNYGSLPHITKPRK